MYLKIVGLIAFLVVSVGLILPFLFSAAANGAIAAGVIYIIVAIPITWKLGKSITTTIKEKINEEN